MDVVEALQAARLKIQKPENWIKGVSARNARGDSVGPEWPSACTWCAIGALFAVTQDAFHPAVEVLRECIPVSNSVPSISGFNDAPATTHEDVLALFDLAIQASATPVEPQ